MSEFPYFVQVILYGINFNVLRVNKMHTWQISKLEKKKEKLILEYPLTLPLGLVQCSSHILSCCIRVFIGTTLLKRKIAYKETWQIMYSRDTLQYSYVSIICMFVTTIARGYSM